MKLTSFFFSNVKSGCVLIVIKKNIGCCTLGFICKSPYTPTPDSKGDDDKKDVSLIIIILLVIVSLLVIASIVILIVLLRKFRKSKNNSSIHVNLIASQDI